MTSWILKSGMAMTLCSSVTVAAEPPTATYIAVDVSGSACTVANLGDTPPADLATNARYRTDLIVMRKIPAGTFTMGKQANGTQHKVTLTKTFYIGVFEVTQGQYARVTGDKPSWWPYTTHTEERNVNLMKELMSDKVSRSEFPGYNLPVEDVKWNDVRGGIWPSGTPGAMTFMGLLRARTGGLPFDLPTEAQWEYACRAGTALSYNDPTKNNGAGSDDEADLGELAQCNEKAPVISPVGRKRPNAWGLYDMHGNVWEWCLDWHAAYSGDAADPVGADTGSARIIRGGSFGSHPAYCGSAIRLGEDPAGWSGDRGFRLALQAER